MATSLLSEDVRTKLNKAMQNARSTTKEEDEYREAQTRSNQIKQDMEAVSNSNATTESRIKVAEIEAQAAKSKEQLYIREEKAFTRRLANERELAKDKYGNNPRALKAQLKFIDDRYNKEQKYYAARRRASAFESKKSASDLAVLQKRNVIEKQFLQNQKKVLDSSTFDAKMKKEALDSVKEQNAQLQKNIGKSKQLIQSRDQAGFRTPLGQYANARTSAWAIDETTGKSDKLKTAAGLGASTGAELAGRAPSQAIGALSGGLSGGVPGMGMEIARIIGENAKLIMGALGTALGGIGGVVGAAIGQVTSDQIQFLMQSSIMKLEWSRLAAKQGMMSTSVGSGAFAPDNGKTGLMLPSMSIAETSQAIKDAVSVGMSPDASKHPFMTLTALNRVYDNVSSELNDMVKTFDSVEEAVYKVDDAFAFGRVAAQRMGTSVEMAAKQMTTASKLARFAGIDASVAQGLVSGYVNKTSSLRNVGIDSDNLGQGVGDLINSPKNMSMAMQYYVASAQGKNKNINPLQAAFMANYGDLNGFKYDESTGAATFGKTDDPVFLKNLKDIQMQYMDTFTKSFGDKASAYVMTQQIFQKQFNMNKSTFDLLSSTEKGKIGSKEFMQNKERISKEPEQYLRHLESMDAINNQMQSGIMNIADSLGAGATDKIIEAIREVGGQKTMTRLEKAQSAIELRRRTSEFNAVADRTMFSNRNNSLGLSDRDSLIGDSFAMARMRRDSTGVLGTATNGNTTVKFKDNGRGNVNIDIITRRSPTTRSGE